MSSPVMPLGSMAWLAQYVIDVHVKAQQTFPDTPNMYSADLHVVGDQGGMDLSALTGRRGRDGQVLFQTRLQRTPIITDPADLPVLKNTPYDIGKYWLIDELDANGHVIGQWAWMWYGTNYRKLMCGTVGDPGPVPAIEPHVTLIEPQEDPTYPDTTSHMSTSGTHQAPSWNFNLAVPAGPPGPVGRVADMPDVDLSPPPAVNTLLACSGRYTAAGEAIFEPISLRNYMPRPYSVPEAAFTEFIGVTQQAGIGSFTIEDPGYDWTPVVWGHIGGPLTTMQPPGIPVTVQQLTGAPFKVGCQALLGDATAGTMVAKGKGNLLGHVNVMPHYSTPDNLAQNITPTNGYAVVKAGASAAERTLHFNLWNDGFFGAYHFRPGHAQMFVLVTPIDVVNSMYAYPTLVTQKRQARRGAPARRGRR